MNSKQMKLNLISTVISFVISLAINFYITPLISGQLGDAAYGFLGMANDFVSYASIISSVLNSVAARFIALELHRGDVARANKYYSSVFVANIVMSIILIVIAMIFVANITRIFQVPSELLKEVQVTFILTFVNYIIVLLSTVFTVCTYITNRLDINGVRNSCSYIIKFTIIIFLVKLTAVHMYYVAIATISASIFLMITNIKLTRKLVPELSLSIRNFKLSYIKVLALSGVWMAISNLSQVLMTGLDSVITNRMLGATMMGILSVARTIPNAIILAISTLGVIFTPNFVQLYAKDCRNELVKASDQSIKIMTMVLGVPIVGVMVFGRDFYTLWLPYKTVEEIQIIQILSILMMLQSVFNALTISLAQLSVVANKLSMPVYVSLGLGVLNVCIVVGMLKYTNFGLFAVAGVSSILFSIRYLVFNPIYAAYVLKKSWNTFYKTIFECLIPMIAVMIIFVFIQNKLSINNWIDFFIVVGIAAAIGYAIVCIFIERKMFLGKKNEKKY